MYTDKGRCNNCGTEGGCGCMSNGNQNTEQSYNCAMQAWAPSLAMVYSPEQCWQGILEPSEALAHGSLFSELVKPFMGGHIR